MLTSVDAERLFQDGLHKPRALVIGAGFGGLSGAVRLAVKGYDVTVLERLQAPGGRASVWKQDGFTFDLGPTVITVPHLFKDLWTLAGRRFEDDIDLRPIDPFYHIRFDDGETFIYSGDAEAMEREVERFSPSDVDGYRRFMRHSDALREIVFEQLGHVPFSHFTDLLKSAPDLIRFGGHLPVYTVASKFVKDPRIRAICSFHPMFIGGNPMSASSAYAMIPSLERKWGVHFPMGGTGKLVEGLVDLLQGLGGRVRCECDVDEILVENGTARGVRLSDGEIMEADVVVSNADSATTYHDLLPSSVPRRWSKGKVSRSRYSMGVFVWYFGTSKRYENVGQHTKVMGQRYRGLLKDIFQRKVLADDFCLYLHRPTQIDPGLAPDGCDTFYVLSPTPNLSAGIDWTTTSEPYRQSIQKRLEETLMPDLGEHIVTSRIMTPEDFVDRYRAFNGAGFGLEPVLTQSAWFRPHNLSEGIKNLYLVGAGTHPGAGVPSVLSSARVLDQLVPDAAAHV